MLRELSVDGVTLRLDLSAQVLGLDAPEVLRHGEPRLRAAPLADAPFVGAAVLAHKAKQVDDALYAAVELAAEAGVGAALGRRGLYERWAAAALAAGARGEAVCRLVAASALGGGTVAAPPDVAARVERETRAFLASEARARPLGFYGESEALTAVFRRDRLLMTELEDASSAAAVGQVLRADPALRGAYEQALLVAARLTNPPSAGAGSLFAELPVAHTHVLPPSRSHEGELVTALFGSRPIPEGFHLAAELARRVASGELSLAPRADSGWYDHQAHALETLVAPGRAEEAVRLQLFPEYERHLLELFEGLLALTRETHVKQIEVPPAGAALRPGPVRVLVQPGLTVEPLATYYLRRARSYRFVGRALEECFGAAWRELPLKAVPSAWPTASAAVEGMEGLLHGAYVRASRELGLERPTPGLEGRRVDEDDAAFRAWAAARAHDTDLVRDARALVPLFYDVERRMHKAWAVLGFAERPVRVTFQSPPRVLEERRDTPAKGVLARVLARLGCGGAASPGVEVEFAPEHHRVPYPVTVELYVEKLLDRTDFRALCDRHETESAIVAALAGAAGGAAARGGPVPDGHGPRGAAAH